MSKKISVFVWILVLVFLIGGSYALIQSQQTTESGEGLTLKTPIYNDLDSDIKSGDTSEDKNNPQLQSQNINGDKADTILQEDVLPRVPDIRLSSTLGQSVSIRDFDEKVVVMYYWASWCPPCIYGMPDIQDLHEQFEKRDDLILIAVNATDGYRETKEVATKFLNDNNYTFLSLFDEESKLANFLNIRFIPSVFVIDKGGVVYKQINKDDIIKTVNELL